MRPSSAGAIRTAFAGKAAHAAPSTTRTPRVLFLDHSSQMSGAEQMLLVIVDRYRESSAVRLFEDGPLRGRLEALGVRTHLPSKSADFSAIKRDRSLLLALPMAGALVRVILDIVQCGRAYDVLYANSEKAFVLGAVAAAIARRPLIWHLHDILAPAHFGYTNRKLVVALANAFATRVIVPSRAAAQAFIASGGRPDRVRLVVNGLVLDQSDLGSDDDNRRALGLPEGFLFGVFSRLCPWKGQHVAIECLVHLPGACCVIVGAALFGEHAYAEELRRLACRLGVAERVIFLGHRDDVPRVMRAVDVVVHPSVAPEPFGRTIVEAMLVARPVISTRTGATPETVLDDETGLLVEPDRPVELARALDRLRTNPALAQKLTETARRRAQDLYSAARMRDGIDKVLHEVLPGESP